jgi:hypothetical protein
MSPRAMLLMAVLAVAGCKSSPDVAGLVSGGAAGAATGSPAVGYLVGISVRTAAAEALNYYGRTRQQAEQDAIAAVAGGLAEGDIASWRIRHDIPYGNEHGTVRVTRAVASPLADCREIMFTVNALPAPPAWYASSICRKAAQWKWAEAEPAVERWGFLQ